MFAPPIPGATASRYEPVPLQGRATARAVGAAGLSAVVETAMEVALVDHRESSDDALFGAVAAIESARRHLDAAEGSMLAELERRNSADLAHGLRTASWLGREAQLSRRTSSARVRVGVALARDLPHTRARFAAGDLSFDHAQVMADAFHPRIADAFLQLEAELLDMAEGWIFEQWQRHVRLVASLLDQDGGYDPHRDVNANRLRVLVTPDGTRLTGTLVGDAALVTETVIEAIADELFRQFAADKVATDGEVSIPSRSTLRALALAEACRRATVVGEGTSSGAGVEATLVIPADDPAAVSDVTGLRRFHPAIGTLTCDLRLHPIVVDSLGVPLDMGREIRTANRAQRRALALRDGGCVFPGCVAPPAHCDAHHVRHWSRDLGRTDVRHMASLCRHHHAVIHRTGWELRIDDAGCTEVISPGGRQIPGQQHGRRRSQIRGAEP